MTLAVTEAELRRLLEEVAFTRSYGFRLQAIGDGRCTLEVPFRAAFERPGGIVSGQVFMAAADVAMWLAIKTVRGIDDPSVTTHMQTHFLQSARQEAFTCTAVVRKLGRRTAFGTAECMSAGGDLRAYHTRTYVIP